MAPVVSRGFEETVCTLFPLASGTGLRMIYGKGTGDTTAATDVPSLLSEVGFWVCGPLMETDWLTARPMSKTNVNFHTIWKLNDK